MGLGPFLALLHDCRILLGKGSRRRGVSLLDCGEPDLTMAGGAEKPGGSRVSYRAVPGHTGMSSRGL